MLETLIKHESSREIIFLLFFLKILKISFRLLSVFLQQRIMMHIYDKTAKPKAGRLVIYFEAANVIALHIPRFVVQLVPLALQRHCEGTPVQFFVFRRRRLSGQKRGCRLGDSAGLWKASDSTDQPA
jgi:hypothetical protein